MGKRITKVVDKKNNAFLLDPELINTIIRKKIIKFIKNPIILTFRKIFFSK